MSLFTRFLRDRSYIDALIPVRAFDGLSIDPDPELASRNAAKAKQLIHELGAKYCCYVDKRDPAGENELMLSSHSHTEF